MITIPALLSSLALFLPADAPVTRGDIGIRIDRPGRVESEHVWKLAWEPKAYGGPVKVLEVVQPAGAVTKGAVVLRLEAEDLARDLAEAERQAHAVKERARLSQQDRRMARTNAELGLERARFAQADAARHLGRWDAYEAAKALEMNELGAQGSRDRLADEREELSQLEKLYEGATLDGQTKDIVLDRARRSLARSERYTDYALRDSALYPTDEHPQRDRDVRMAARHAAVALEHATLALELSAVRDALAEADEAHAIEESSRRVSELRADAAALEVRAPEGGVLALGSLQPGDGVSRGAQLATVQDPRALRIRAQLPPEALRIASTGSPVRLWFPQLPALACQGSIAELGAIAQPEGDGALFPAMIALSPGASPPPIGLGTRVIAEGVVRGALRVPKAAVHKADDGRTFVRVREGEQLVQRFVLSGASDDTHTEIVDGLREGELVETPDA